MFLFLTFFLGILSSICFYSVINKTKDDSKNPMKWVSIWSIFMNEFIEGIRVRNSKVVFLGVAAIVLLVLALICFFKY
jgi:hypothetical protein